VGYGGKWQDLINITRKSFNTVIGKWDLNELYEGSKIYPPSFKSKWAVNEFRAEIRKELPIMQDRSGTAAWFELPKLVEESIRDKRREGYLQGGRDKPEDAIRLHWGGDAAQYFRGIKTTRVGYRLPDAAKVVQNHPRQYRSVLQFEGKDDYASHKEYLQPMFPVMDMYAEEGITVDGTRYKIKQSLEGDNVFFAEACGHCGHSHNNGCFLCDAEKKHFGTNIANADGKRLPMQFNQRTLEQVSTAAHRPLKVGPGEKCHYCPATFPNQAAVDALPVPATKAAHTTYATLHKGIRFGTPPLFKFSFTEIYLCILHCLLRLVAIVFQRTIKSNLDTIAKVDATNSTMRALKLSCKKVGLPKKTAASTKDTEPINFIGR
jgi:hypothetical protein